MEFLVGLIVLGIGLLSLLLGRKLFWIYVGFVGFVFGAALGAFFGNDLGIFMQVVFALLIGLGAAVLSIYLQKPMACLVNFFLGGLLVSRLFAFVGMGSSLWLLLSDPVSFLLYNANGALVVFLAAGLIFAVVTWLLFEWTLIVISSLTGALLVVGALSVLLPLSFLGSLLPLLLLVAWFGVAALGVFAQVSMLKKPMAALAPQVSYPNQPALPPLSAPPTSLPPSAAGVAPALAANAAVCPNCGAVAKPGARFCNHCGAALAP